MGKYDPRVLSEDENTFSTTNPDTKQTETYSKNQGVMDQMKESVALSDKAGQRLAEIRQNKGWNSRSKPGQ